MTLVSHETGLISCETGLMLDETGLVSRETGPVLHEITLVSHETGPVLGKGRCLPGLENLIQTFIILSKNHCIYW